MKYYRPPKDPGMYSKGDFPYIPGIETINPALGRGLDSYGRYIWRFDYSRLNFCLQVCSLAIKEKL